MAVAMKTILLLKGFEFKAGTKAAKANPFRFYDIDIHELRGKVPVPFQHTPIDIFLESALTNVWAHTFVQKYFALQIFPFYAVSGLKLGVALHFSTSIFFYFMSD